MGNSDYVSAFFFLRFFFHLLLFYGLFQTETLQPSLTFFRHLCCLQRPPTCQYLSKVPRSFSALKSFKIQLPYSFSKINHINFNERSLHLLYVSVTGKGNNVSLRRNFSQWHERLNFSTTCTFQNEDMFFKMYILSQKEYRKSK